MHTPSRIRIPTAILAIGLAIGALFIYLATKAHAADKGGPGNMLADVAPTPGGTWTGCGPALRAGWTMGTADVSPVTFGAEGAHAGVGFGCDYQAGKHFLIGAFVNYDWAFGDLGTLGVNNDLSIGARVGVPLNRNVMLYGGGAWSRIDVDHISSVDGWKAIAGLEVRLATDAPLFFSMEGSRGFYKDVGGSGMDANATAVTASLKYKFGAK